MKELEKLIYKFIKAIAIICLIAFIISLVTNLIYKN